MLMKKNIGAGKSCKKNIDSKNITGIFAQVSTCYLYIISREVTFIKRVLSRAATKEKDYV